MSLTRVIIIDPYNEIITEKEIELKLNDLKPLYKLAKCDCFSFVYSIKDHFLLVDDNGLLINDPVLFLHRSYPQPLAGIGIILGKEGEEGDLTSATVSLKEVKRDTAFVSKILKFTGVKMSEGDTDHPIFGKMHTITNTPIFEERKDEDNA